MEILNFKGQLSDLIYILKKGDSIHIKKKNRGKFTEYCGGKVTEECIAKGKKSKDPKIRKRATFAANARKWKHANGGPLGRPNFKESKEAYYDPETDTVFAPDSLGEFYHHEMFHARPNLQLLESLKPYYHNLNDDVLKQMGADLSFVKRFNNDPGHFYSPEELGARIVSASEMFNRMGVKDVTLDFLKNARLNENTYGDNFRDLLHMYNDDNLIKIFNAVKKHENGGILKAQEGTGNLYAPHPLSPVGIALNQAKIMAKMKGEQQHLPPGVKEVVGPDGQKIAIRTEQPLQPMGQEVAAWLPGVGDVVEVGQIANDVKNGNFGTAALAAGLMVLPGNARKILDKFGVDLGDINTFARLSDQEWDDMYFQAIDSGDMDLVQTIRDAHFKVKAPNTKAVDSDGNPIKLFHGEKDSPTYHDLRYLNSGPDHKGLGVYYSSSSNDIAKTYAQHKGGPTGQVREVYYNIKNPNVVDAEGRSFQTVLIEEGAYGSKTGVSTDQLVNRTYWDKAPEGYRKKSDKDGLIIQNVEDHAPGWTGSSKDAIADNYVTWNPYAVKSAEAVVRHPKTGEIIPLSKRDNFNVPSILMGMTPLILGLGTAKTVSNNSNTKEQQ